jgi:hypothetical protein
MITLATGLIGINDDTGGSQRTSVPSKHIVILDVTVMSILHCMTRLHMSVIACQRGSNFFNSKLLTRTIYSVNVQKLNNTTQ